ncbi:ABC transporter permease, partial [Ruminococcaceae bacterium OttesenSCG-928-L11]|nr:ABC transporter permease [Ruminococcaceae bacterium OttesenSCG-928-L11]
YLGDVFLRADLGTSYISKVSITATLMQRLPRTILMAVFSMIVSMGMGIPLGVFSAVNQDTWKDRLTMLLAMLGISMPNFWLALC